VRFLSFYWRVVGIVWRARRLAVRGRYDDMPYCASALTTLRAVERCGGTVEVTGLEHVRATPGPVVVIGNHMSSLETFGLAAFMLPDKPVTFVVKQSLLSHPFFGPVMRSREPIAVGRRNPREDLKAVLTQGVAKLAAGTSIIVFPQSTRRVEFVAPHFNSIGAKLAERAGVPVIPMALRTDFWGNGRRVKDCGPVGRCREVRFAFGPAIPAGTPARQTHAAVVEFLRLHLPAWGVPWLESAAGLDGGANGG
jgi:1-acyl-sn-glycerol-3-phosphate acyltransferase